MPYSPTSHPYVERLIGTIRREYLDRLFFWNARDLERKLNEFVKYDNENRVHPSLDGKTPTNLNDGVHVKYADLGNYCWRSHCNGLY